MDRREFLRAAGAAVAAAALPRWLDAAAAPPARRPNVIFIRADDLGWRDKVSKPVAARLGWAGRPYINLWTESGLPTSPFRTDDWPISSKREK